MVKQLELYLRRLKELISNNSLFSVIEEWKRRLEDRARVRQTFGKLGYLFKGKDNVKQQISTLKDSNRNLHDGIQLIPFFTGDPREIAGEGVIEFLKEALTRAASGREPSAMRSPCDFKQYEDKAGVTILGTKSGDFTLIKESFTMTQSSSRRIAALLNGSRARASPSKGRESAFIALPRCKFIDNDSGFIFELPVPNAHPVSLLAYLLDPDTLYTLESRVALALHLARAVLVIHSLNMVHKGISSDNIFILDADRSPGVLGVPCILRWGGNGSVRFEDDDSYGNSFPSRSHNVGFDGSIYRHPKHDVEKREKMQMRDDVYSLGVCLLEIALWKPIACARYNFSGPMSSELRGIRSTGERTKCLVDIARKWVPLTMGSVFADVVVTCLECWEYDVEDNNNESDYDDDEEELRRHLSSKEEAFRRHLSSEAQISIKFSKRVVKKLARIYAGIALREEET